MKKEWVERIRRQCRGARVPFFFKQWGGVRKSEAGRLLGGRTYDQMPYREEPSTVTRRMRLHMIDEVDTWKAKVEAQVA
jgi:hypothetical protein